MGHRSLVHICAAAALIAALCVGPVRADAAPMYDLDLPSQPLADALRALGRLTDTNILIDRRLVGHQTAPALKAHLTAEDAVAMLLTGTGLAVKRIDERTITLVAVSGNTSSVLSPQMESGETRERVRLAQSEGVAVTMAVLQPVPATSGSGDTGAPSAGVPEILVRGSKVLNTAIARTRDDAQPYVVFDRAAIDKSGTSNIDSFLREHLSSMNPAPPNSQLVSTGGANNSYFDLRGLGTTQTLILIDGHRSVSPNISGGGLQTDLNSIPMSAIERIEVLPTTASGIYGGSATGGVINVILRRDYTGLETTLTYDDTFDGGGARRQIQMSGGFPLEGGRTTVLLTGSYTDGDDLLVGDRDLFRRAQARILANSPDSIIPGFSPPIGATTNICSGIELFPGFAFCDGSPLTLDDGTPLGAATTFVPAGYAGRSADDGAALVRNAGAYNFALANSVQANGGARQTLVDIPTVKSLTTTVRREFTPGIQAFLDLSAAKNSGSVANEFLSGSFAIPADSVINPFRQTIVVTTPLLGTEQVARTSIEDTRAVGGVIFALPRRWQGELDYTWGHSRLSRTEVASALTPDAAAAVASGITQGGTPFDVLRDTNSFPVDFSTYLSAAPIVPTARTNFRDTSLRFSGPVGRPWPGGLPTLTLLVEHRREGFSDYRVLDPVAPTVRYAQSQSVDSAYLETMLPIVTASNAMPGLRTLELQAAVRRDEYTLRGANFSFTNPPDPEVHSRSTLQSTDPTFGLRYMPIGGITFRASYGTGFLPPQSAQTVPGPTLTTDGLSSGLTDPRRGGEPLGVFTYTTGGNPDLKPEDSESRSAGIILTPVWMPSLRVSVDWTRINKRNNLTFFTARQPDLNNELAIPGLVTRGPPSDGFEVGPVIAFKGPLFNIARQTIEAWDLAVDYRWARMAWGTFALSGVATRNMHNTQQALASLPVEEYVGVATLPWQGRAALDWEGLEQRSGQWTAQWAVRYFDSYCLNQLCAEGFNTPSQGGVDVSSQTYHDLTLAFRFNSEATRALAGSEIRLGIKNIFDHKPPLDVNVYARYYSGFADPRLASYYLSVRKKF